MKKVKNTGTIFIYHFHIHIFIFHFVLNTNIKTAFKQLDWYGMWNFKYWTFSLSKNIFLWKYYFWDYIISHYIAMYPNLIFSLL